MLHILKKNLCNSQIILNNWIKSIFLKENTTYKWIGCEECEVWAHNHCLAKEGLLDRQWTSKDIDTKQYYCVLHRVINQNVHSGFSVGTTCFDLFALKLEKKWRFFYIKNVLLELEVYRQINYIFMLRIMTCFYSLKGEFINFGKYLIVFWCT